MEWRLRALQRLSVDLLFVAGIDGRDNQGTFDVLQWLTQEEEEEHDDETVLLVTKSNAAILYRNPQEPLLRCGMKEYRHHDDLSKCLGFRQMLEDLLEDQQDVGICCSSSQSRDEIEFWPLVQSLASEDVHNSPFFFSSRYTPIDATAIVKRAISSIDPNKLKRTINSANKLLRHHIDQLVPDQTISADILQTFATYGSSSDDDGKDETFAFVVGQKTTKKDSPSEEDNADVRPLVFQAQDPTSGILVCRTYFTRSGNHRLYSELVRSFQNHCSRILSQYQENSLRKKALEDAIGGNCACLVQDVDEHDLVYVRAWIVDESVPIAAVGDTFLVGQASSSPGETWLAQGESGLITGDRCAPYIRSWHIPNQNCRQDMLRDPHRSRDLLGAKVVSNISTSLISSDDSVLPLSVLKAKVDLYEAGLVLSLPNDSSSKYVVSIKDGDVSDAFVVGRLDEFFALAFDFRQSGLLPGSVALLVRHNSENHRTLQSMLPTWRDHIRRADGVESSDRDMKRDSFRRVFETLFGKARVDDLLSAFTEAYQLRILDGLWLNDASPKSFRERGKSNLYGLIGLPGSGVLEVAATIKRRESEEDSWSVVHAVYTMNEIDKDATAAAIDKSENGRLVLIVACCRDHVLSLLSAMDRSAAGEVRGCGVVISEDDKCNAWWDQCIPGLTTAAIEFGKPKRVRKRRNGPPTRLVSASRGSKMGLGTAIIDALLEVEVDPKNYLPGGRKFCQVDLPPKKKVQKEAKISIDFVLDRALLEKAVRHVLPRAKHVASRIAALAPNNATERKTVLKGLLDNATMKTKYEERLFTWDRDVDGWKHSFVSDEVAIAGIVRMSTKGTSYASPVGFDANSAIFSTWPDTTNQECFVIATGLTEEALSNLVKLCAKDRITPLPPKQLKHLTPEELDFSNVPLPPGWAFDGSCYVDAFGCRSKARPDFDQLVTLALNH